MKIITKKIIILLLFCISGSITYGQDQDGVRDAVGNSYEAIRLWANTNGNRFQGGNYDNRFLFSIGGIGATLAELDRTQFMFGDAVNDGTFRNDNTTEVSHNLTLFWGYEKVFENLIFRNHDQNLQTGMASSGSIGFLTGSTRDQPGAGGLALFLSENQNVGIGTEYPRQILHVVGDSEIDGLVYVNGLESKGTASFIERDEDNFSRHKATKITGSKVEFEVETNVPNQGSSTGGSHGERGTYFIMEAQHKEGSSGEILGGTLTFKKYENSDPLMTIINSSDPSEILNVNGGMRVGNSNGTNSGTIRWTGSDFQGYNGTEWKSFTSGGSGDIANNGLRLTSNTGVRSWSNLRLIADDDNNGGSAENIIFGYGGDFENFTETMRIQSGTHIVTMSNTSKAGLTIKTTDNAQSNGIAFQNSADSYTWAMYRKDAGDNKANLHFDTGLEADINNLAPVMTLTHDKDVIIGATSKAGGSRLTVGGAVHIGERDTDPSRLSLTNSGYLLWVEKGIVTEDMALASVTDWNDEVFEEDYDLKTVEEVEAFIEENGHLPNFPSEEEIVSEGSYSVKEMNGNFMKQLEELMLYTIDQQKQIKSLQAELQTLRAELDK